MILYTLLVAAQAAPGPLPTPIVAPATVSVEPADSPYGLGVGLQLGEVTGLNLAWRPDERYTVQLQGGYSLLHKNAKVNADFLLNLVIVESPALKTLQIPLYVGLGAHGVFGDGVAHPADPLAFGVRVPVGVGIQDTELPLDAFLEGSVIAAVGGGTLYLDFSACAGARIWF